MLCVICVIQTTSVNDIAMASSDLPAEGSCPPLDRRVPLPYLHGNIPAGSRRPGAVSGWCEWFLLAKSSRRLLLGNCQGNLETMWFTIFWQPSRSCSRISSTISLGESIHKHHCLGMVLKAATLNGILRCYQCHYYLLLSISSLIILYHP